jgi:6-phosphogluconate dehydrogenase
MGANMVRRLSKAGHQCVVYDVNAQAVQALEKEGAVGSTSLEEFAAKLTPPRVAWLMVPAAFADDTIEKLREHLQSGDIIIDGGNSYYRDDIHRANRLKENGIHYIDVGTSGGVWGLDRGYCLMIGGDDKPVAHLDSIFATLSPSMDSVSRTPGRDETPKSTSEQGYLHCGPVGAGHFVKMVHNGIEYGVMAAYAEGFNLLHRADIGKQNQTHDAETTPLRHPEYYQYDFKLEEIAEVWRRGSVVGSWLLDLTAEALLKTPELENYSGHVSDSGEGRWTNIAAIEEGVPIHVLSAALFDRFSSRENADYANKMLSAMRYAFGGHHEKSAD